MELTRANLDSIYTGYNAIFTKGLSQVSQNWEKFATKVQSTSAIERYPFINLTSGMEKWIGDRKISHTEGKMIEVVNDDYSNAVEVNRNYIMWDKIGLYNSMFTDLGINAANLWPRLACKALASNPKWADGKNFFAENHKFGKAVINNKTDDAFSESAYETARSAIMSYTDSTGEPLALVPDLLMVGPTNEKKAKRVLKAELIVPDGATAPESNLNKDTAELEVNPLLSGEYADLWFLMVTTRGYKPVAVQKAKEGALTRQDQEDLDCVFNHNVNRYGVHYIGNATPTLPQLCYGGGFGS